MRADLGQLAAPGQKLHKEPDVVDLDLAVHLQEESTVMPNYQKEAIEGTISCKMCNSADLYQACVVLGCGELLCAWYDLANGY